MASDQSCAGAFDGEAAAEPEQILEVAWLDGAPVSEGVARVHRDQVSRRRPPLTQPLVAAWIQENAHAQPVQVTCSCDPPRCIPCRRHCMLNITFDYGTTEV